MRSDVSVKKHSQVIPTYLPKQPNKLPMFFEHRPYQGASGKLYPLAYSDGITDVKTDVSYDVFTLENEYVKTQVLPAIGGKILRGFDKIGKYDFIYYNEVIKPALVGLAGAWISGGIEFNFPQHHRPTTFLPLEAIEERGKDGSVTVWSGEVEPFGRMRGQAGITLEPGRSYIKAKVRVYNRTDLPQVFMWWANLAVPVNENTRTIFPPDVEWVNDHDRRAVISWPIAKGVFHTARPFDYGEGTDLSRYDSVKVPSSFLISQGQTEYDFVASYDSGVRKGIAAVGNHHIVPGKKMWTWGHGDFGAMWCANLTDKNGPYIELMTGAYTDNQPDFTWIGPYETREFEQYWYPIREIGDVKNATVDGACNLEQRGDDLFFGFNVTGTFENCRIELRDGETVVFSEEKTLSPDAAYCKTIPLGAHRLADLKLSLTAEDGKVLVAYQPPVRGNKKPIEVRKPVARPREIATTEELYLNGLHLEQYKQHNYDPKDYYAEGLRRDPGDSRCNTGMGRLLLKEGRFAEAVDCFDRAIERLTIRNQHPTDTEALYLKGVALMYLGREKEAYDVLYRAAWNYPHRSCAYFKLATLDCKMGDFQGAIEKLDLSYGLNEGHLRAKNLKACVLHLLGEDDEAIGLLRQTMETDKLDLWSRFEYLFLTGKDTGIRAQFGGKPENYLDVVCDYLEAGLTERALQVLEYAGRGYRLFDYYRAYCLHLLGRETADALKQAEQTDASYCFPSRLGDIAVLRFAAEGNRKDAIAIYLLGCLYYDRKRYKEGIACWEEAVKRDPELACAYRNLALGYFDKCGDGDAARKAMEKAVALSDDPRLLLEYQQLLKNRNVSPADRLALYKKYPQQLDARDDCYLDRIVLLCQLGRYKEAIDAAAVRRFHIYEGGEGKLTKQHAWMHVLYGLELARAGKTEEAERAYTDGLRVPKSYGEAKTFFNQEAHVYYYLSRLLRAQGRTEEAQAALEEASVYKAAVSELSLFRALALQELGHSDEADAVLEEMLAAGRSQIENCDRRSYYGVGSPTPMPFEDDIVKQNTVNGHILCAFALLGKGQKEKALAEIAEAAELEPYHFAVTAFSKITETL